MHFPIRGTATLADMSSSLAGVRSALGACLAVAVLASVPTAALAQGAGDEQYADPIVRDGGGQQPAPAPEPDTGDAPAAPVAPSSDAAPAAGSSQSATTATLPRTGVDAGLLAALGVVLLASGSLLRARSAQSVSA
jgi:LPXTG-motif cell wall-anchored protein